jgi:hypothetical protein
MDEIIEANQFTLGPSHSLILFLNTLFSSKAGCSLLEDIGAVIWSKAQTDHSQKAKCYKKWQSAGYSPKFFLAIAVMPQEVSNVGLSPLCIIFMKCEVVLKLCSNYPQIVNEAGMIPGALEVDGINLVLMENIVLGISIIVNPTAVRLVQDGAVPPISQHSIVHEADIPIQLELIQNLVKMSELILLVIASFGAIMELS